MRLRVAASLIAVLATTGALVAVGFLPATAIGADASGSAAVTVTPLQAALIGLGYYFSMSPWWFGVGLFTFYRPLVAGLCVGIILGDPAQGALIGAAINLFYLGFIAAGGAIPSDPSLAGWLGTTIAIAGVSYGRRSRCSSGSLARPSSTRMTVDSASSTSPTATPTGWLRD
jgi:hypothetical protein